MNVARNSTLDAAGKSRVDFISKRDIIEEVASTHDLSVAKSERIVNTIFDTIVEAVVDGKQARLSNFGSFDSYISKARSGRNPATGEAIEIASKRRIRFKAYDTFKKSD
jgi:nucleoid DNA-binding protein